MSFINNLSEKEYMNFISDHFLAHYTKTSMWAHLQKAIPHYVGLKKNEEIIASALILEKKWLGFTYFYIPAGPCFEMDNLDSLSELIKNIIDFAKERNAFMIRTDPNIQRCSKNIQGETIDGINNEFITEFLIQLGFNHKGYGYAYNGSWMNRFTLLLNIEPDFDTIFSGFIKSRQNRLKRHEKMGISTRIADESEVNQLCILEKDLAKYQGFKPHSPQFFKKLLNAFQGQSVFYLTEINLSTLYQMTLDELNSNKYAKDKEAYESKKKSLNEIEVLQKKFGDKTVIAGGITLYFNHQSWNLYLYNKKEFTFLNGSDNTHIFSIQDLKKKGVTQYDLCGFSGNVDKKDPYYGLYNYKSSFGTTYIEQIGEFDYVLSPPIYKFFLNTYRIYSKVRRRINYHLNKKKS